MKFLALCLLASQSVGWAAEKVCVVSMAVPDYPRLALMARIQGSVRVEIEIDRTGKVVSAEAMYPPGAPKGLKLLGPHAAKNVATWQFFVSRDEKTFPIKHSVTYVYKLQGKETYAFPCSTVTLHAADRVEIVTPPPAVMTSRQP
jgi:TonB family protein